MKAVIDGRLAFSLFMPVIDALNERLAFVLNCEVDDRRGSAVGCGACAGEKVIRGLSAAERKLHVSMWIDAPGNNQLAGGIYHFIHFHFELRADDGDELTVYQNVCAVVVSGRDYAAVLDKSFHVLDVTLFPVVRLG